MTWNAGATTPYHLQHSDQDAAFFKSLIQESDCPDVIVFGFQELVDLEDKKTVTSMYPITTDLADAGKLILVQKASLSHRRRRIPQRWST